jgi:hypothetical protein
MRKKQKIINLFKDRNICSIKHVISISSEEDLNQFWDFTTNSNNVKYEHMHTFVTQFYNFIISYMRNNTAEFFDIILEESNKFFYFTLWNKKISFLFQDYIKKSSIKFLCTDSRITIQLDKSKHLKDFEQKKSKVKDKQHKKNKPYNFLHKDDLTDFSNLMNTNEKAFKKLDKHQYKIVVGFINNIDNWLQSIFIEGGVNLYHMDKSMKKDYLKIEEIILSK